VSPKTPSAKAGVANAKVIANVAARSFSFLISAPSLSRSLLRHDTLA
jgi:hypothetical protein